MLYKIVLFTMLAAVGASMVGLCVTGYQNTRFGLSQRRHKVLARILLGIVILLVLLVEAGVRLKGGATVDGLFVTHLLCASGYLSLIVLLNFWLSGEKKSAMHGFLAHGSILFYVCMVATAIPLVLRF